MEALEQIDAWPAETAAVAVVAPDGAVAQRGPDELVLRWASVTKLFAAYAVLVAAEEGVLDLEEPAGPPGSTVRHLLAHASGLPFEGGEPMGRPEERRIYSNTGFDLLGELLAERAEMEFGAYLRAAVLAPLELGSVELRGRPSEGLHGSLRDLARFGRELLAPTLVAPETLAEATEVAFPGLVGVLPGIGRQEPNDWGLGFELRDAKQPHWTGARNSPRTFGHFGGAGTFLWVDPDARCALACLTNLEFDEWALVRPGHGALGRSRRDLRWGLPGTGLRAHAPTARRRRRPEDQLRLGRHRGGRRDRLRRCRRQGRGDLRRQPQPAVPPGRPARRDRHPPGTGAARRRRASVRRGRRACRAGACLSGRGRAADRSPDPGPEVGTFPGAVSERAEAVLA